MKEGMVTVLREEIVTDLLTETIIVNDPRVQIVEIGAARTTVIDQKLIPDLNQEEIIITIKLKVLKMKDIAGLYYFQLAILCYFLLCAHFLIFQQCNM